jgi:hypothetical protein
MDLIHKLRVLVFWLSAALPGIFQQNAIQNIYLGFVRKRNRVFKNRISDFMSEKNGVHSDVGKKIYSQSVGIGQNAGHFSRFYAL